MDKTGGDKVVLLSYRQDEDERQMPRQASRPELTKLVLRRANLSLQELIKKGCAKLNIKLSAFEDLVISPSLCQLDYVDSVNSPETKVPTFAIMMQSL